MTLLRRVPIDTSYVVVMLWWTVRALLNSTEIDPTKIITDSQVTWHFAASAVLRHWDPICSSENSTLRAREILKDM